MIYYEWTLEIIKDDEIYDIDFSNNLTFDKSDLNGNDFGLVRNTGNDTNGLCSRLWAYVKNGKLPIYFSNEMGEQTNIKIPRKFHKELAKYLS